MRIFSVVLAVAAVALWGCGGDKKDDDSAQKQFDAMVAVYVEDKEPNEAQKKLIEEAVKLSEADFVKKFAPMIKAKYMDKEENFTKITAKFPVGQGVQFAGLEDASKAKHAEGWAKALRTKAGGQ